MGVGLVRIGSRGRERIKWNVEMPDRVTNKYGRRSGQLNPCFFYQYILNDAIVDSFTPIFTDP